MSVDWSEKVREALGRTEFMALSTIGSDGSWTNPVEYHYDDKLNFYFISMMDAKHVSNILSDPRVSAAIYKTERFPGADGHVLGLQLKGTARHLTEVAEINEAARCYGRRPGEAWHFFKITPEELWCFDSRVSESREKVDLHTFDSL